MLNHGRRSGACPGPTYELARGPATGTSTTSPAGARLRAIVHGAAVPPGALVYDLGTGPEVLAAVLAASGARVVLVERDARFATRPAAAGFVDDADVRVIEADLRAICDPRAARIVANLPFATSGAVVAHLLDPAGAPCAGADLVVEEGFARRLSSRRPRSAQGAWRAARYELALVRRVPRAAFAPAPGVDAALLRIIPRPPLTPAAARRPRALLTAAFMVATSGPARWLAARPAGMPGRGCWRRQVSRSTPTRWRCRRKRGRQSRAAI